MDSSLCPHSEDEECGVECVDRDMYGTESWEGKGPMSFGDNLERLDEILRRLESEPMPLDEALEAFERGVSLVRESRGILERGEQRVTLLTQDGERPFEGSAGGENEKVEN